MHNRYPGRILNVYYVSVLLIINAVVYFIPGIRFGDIIYLNAFRVAFFAGLYLIALRIMMRRDREIWFKFYKQDKLFLVLYAVLLVSIIWSVDRTESLRQLYSILFYILFYLYIAIVFRTNNRYELFKYYFLLAPFVYLAISLVLLAKFGSLRPSLNILESYDLLEMASFSNQIAAFSEISAPFLFFAMIISKKKLKIVAICSFIVLIVTLILTGSRGAMLILLFMGLISFIIVFLKQKVIKFSIYIILSLIIFTSAISYLPIINSSITGMKERMETLNNLEKEERYDIFRAGFEIIKEKPILGWGYGTHGTILKDKYSLVSISGKGAISHNIIITIWSGAGISGVIVFIYMMYYVFKQLGLIVLEKINNKEEGGYFEEALFVAFIGTIMHGMIRPLMPNINLYFILALSSVCISRWRFSEYG